VPFVAIGNETPLPLVLFTQDCSPSGRRQFADGQLASNKRGNIDAQNRLPPVSVAKLLRDKRLRKLGKSSDGGPLNNGMSLDGVPLSWNYTYNALENYSFN
jgi:hypothetical protein